MNRNIYEKYAKLLLRIGCALTPGENLLVQAHPNMTDFVRVLTETAYRLGARYVQVDYLDPAIAEIRCWHSPVEYLSDVPSWVTLYRTQQMKEGAAVIQLFSPAVEEGFPLPSHRWEKMYAGELSVLKEVEAVRNAEHISGVKACLPTSQWAKKVYPELSTEDGLRQLWADFIHINRLDHEDPVVAWEYHKRKLAQYKEKLESLHISELWLRGPGTDLKVKLLSGHQWMGGCEQNLRTGREYTPNIPTEEIFTVPDKYGVEGVVSATLPLNYQGRLIQDIKLRFSHGLVCDWSVGDEKALFEQILNTDPGARRLGEIALVPVDSPIYQSKRIFYHTLFDENAVCHLALGRAAAQGTKTQKIVPAAMKDAAGLNESKIHVDFMVGSEQMTVLAKTANGTVSLMNKGLWTI